MEDKQSREEFDTALARIRHDIKGRLVIHGFFGTSIIGMLRRTTS